MSNVYLALMNNLGAPLLIFQSCRIFCRTRWTPNTRIRIPEISLLFAILYVNHPSCCTLYENRPALRIGTYAVCFLFWLLIFLLAVCICAIASNWIYNCLLKYNNLSIILKFHGIQDHRRKVFLNISIFLNLQYILQLSWLTQQFDYFSYFWEFALLFSTLIFITVSLYLATSFLISHLFSLFFVSDFLQRFYQFLVFFPL